MTRKPDRFEVVARKAAQQFSHYLGEPLEQLDGDELGFIVSKLLRAEHRRVVRAVKKLQAAVANDPCDWTRGYECACVDILAVLTRVKGGR